MLDLADETEGFSRSSRDSKSRAWFLTFNGIAQDEFAMSPNEYQRSLVTNGVSRFVDELQKDSAFVDEFEHTVFKPDSPYRYQVLASCGLKFEDLSSRPPSNQHAVEAASKLFDEHMANVGPTSLFRYIKWQLERAPTTNHLHCHAYVQLVKQQRFSFMTKLFPGVDIRMVSLPDCADKYVGKVDTRVAGPWKFGTRETEQGKRNDVHALVGGLIDGTYKNLRDCAGGPIGIAVAAFKYSGNILRFQQALGAARDCKTKTSVYFGAAGSGKTTAASKYLAGICQDDVFNMPSDLKFIDGYSGQTGAVADDCMPGLCSLHQFLRLCDRTPLDLDVKNSKVSWRCKELVITSNRNPLHWYRNTICDDQNLFDAFVRRIDVCYQFSWDGDEYKIEHHWLCRCESCYPDIPRDSRGCCSNEGAFRKAQDAKFKDIHFRSREMSELKRAVLKENSH